MWYSNLPLYMNLATVIGLVVLACIAGYDFLAATHIIAFKMWHVASLVLLTGTSLVYYEWANEKFDQTLIAGGITPSYMFPEGKHTMTVAFAMVVWAIGVLISLVYYQHFLKHSYWYEVNYRLPGRSDKWLRRCNVLSFIMFMWMMFIIAREDKIEDVENIV